MPVQFWESGLCRLSGGAARSFGGALVGMLLTAAHADDGCGEHRGETEFLRSIDDLVWLLSIDESFRNDKAWAHGADSRFG